MPDNVTLPGTGTLVALDEIAGGVADGAMVERIKMGYGADGAYGDVEMDNPLPVIQCPADTADLANISAVAGTATSLAAARPARKGMVVVNDSTANLFIAYGAANASTTRYTYKLAAGVIWEMPQPVYTGTIYGVWDAANGAARVTELA